jgi:precorrin-4 methylase
MGEEENTCITWKFGSGRLHLGDLRAYGMIVIKCVVLKKYGINIEV